MIASSKKQPIVSVVLPTCNRPQLVQRALRSILNQSYRAIEILVIDDSENSDTQQISQSWTDDRVQYLKNKQRRGANSCRNLGISLSEGEWIAFLDDDDVWLPEKLEKQLEVALNAEAVVLVYTGRRIHYEAYQISYDDVPSTRGDLAKRILINNCIGTTSSVMVKKQAFQLVGGFDESLPALQDYDLWIRLCQIGRVDYVKNILVHYHHHNHEGQITKNHHSRTLAESNIDAKYQDLFVTLDPSERIKRRQMQLLDTATRMQQTGNLRQAHSLTRRALSLHPSPTTMTRYLLTFLPFRVAILGRRLFQVLVGLDVPWRK